MVSVGYVGRMFYERGDHILVVSFLLRCSVILLECLRIFLPSSGCRSDLLTGSWILLRIETTLDSHSTHFVEFFLRHPHLRRLGPFAFEIFRALLLGLVLTTGLQRVHEVLHGGTIRAWRDRELERGNFALPGLS